jgi:hypothetical protein
MVKHQIKIKEIKIGIRLYFAEKNCCKKYKINQKIIAKCVPEIAKK